MNNALGARDKVSFYTKEGVWEVVKVTPKWIGYLNGEREVKWRPIWDFKCIVEPRRRMRIEKRRVKPIALELLQILQQIDF
jgi:hypothetical protein